MTNPLPVIAAWRSEQRTRAAFACTPTPLDQLQAWTVTPNAIEHRSGGFFRVVAMRANSNLPALDNTAQPFIHQPEIGILGFLASPGPRGPRLLVQAKTEPGNVGAVQLAPSFQCTPSNYTARHGGTPAPFLDLFTNLPPGATIRSDLVHSEQGTRFLGKFNRNMMVERPEAPAPANPAWRWLDAADLLPLLRQDNLINTDARSVLAGTQWVWLCNGPPFARWQNTNSFGAALHTAHSAGEHGTEHPLPAVLSWLAAHRAAARLHHEPLALAALPGWTLAADAWTPSHQGGFALRGYTVQAHDREVATWHQPLVDSPGIGQIALLCQRRRGILHVLLHACAEPGLASIIEFGASLQSAPGTPRARLPQDATIHLRCRQSEEGGRFHQDENDYLVAELPETTDLPPTPDHLWVGIAQLEALCQTPGLTTNELRSATALLLSLAA